MKLSTVLRPPLLILVFILGMFSRTQAAPGDVDLSFDPGSGVNGRVNAVVVQPDGKVIVGGSFRTVKGLLRRAIARLNADGSGDSTFVNRGPNDYINYVSAVVIQPDGKVLVGYEAGITRLNADGIPDPTFSNPKVAGGVSAIALQTDGKILIGGRFSSVDERLRSCIARLNADGTLDQSFNPGGGVIGPVPSVSDIALQPDGKLLIAGPFAGYHQTYRYSLARLNADGSLDESFDADLAEDGAVYKIALQPDGKVLFGGAFALVNGTLRRSIARVNADGSPDGSFDPGTGLDGGYIVAMALQLNGSVLIGGIFDTVNGTSRKGIARLNTDGSLDGSFEPPGGYRLVPTAFAVEPDGKLLVGGHDMVGTLSKHDSLIRVHTDGSRDPSFVAGGGLEAPVYMIAVQPDGKVMIAAHARLHVDGTRDPSFNLDPDADGTFGTVTLLPDGRMLVGGGPSYAIDGASTGHGGIARVHADGSLDRSFDAGTGFDGGGLGMMAMQPDGKVLIAGQFDSVNGVERKDFVRLNADGSVDTTFVFDPNLESAVTGFLAVQPDGKVLVGGFFAEVGATRYTLPMVRVNPDGSRDATFNFPRLGYVQSIVIQPDGKVLVGGSFRTQENDLTPARIQASCRRTL